MREKAFAAVIIALTLILRVAAQPSADILPAYGGGYVDLRAPHPAYTLILFWRADCDWSVQELEALNAATPALAKAHDVRVLTVAVETPVDTVPGWLDLHTGLDVDGLYSARVGVNATPAALVVHGGKVVTEKAGTGTDFELLLRLAAQGLDYNRDTVLEG